MADSKALDRTYWTNHLEVDFDLVVNEHADRRRVSAWLAALAPRCRDVLVTLFQIEPNQEVGAIRTAIGERHDALLPFMLVDAATANKRTHAIVEVARTKLSARHFDICRLVSNEERFDRHALMWLLYLDEPSNLELVFQCDRIQRKGFARMVLASQPALPERIGSLHTVDLSLSTIQQLLDEYESENRTLRESHCADVLDDGATYKVFIKRDHRPSFVSRGSRNTFGFEREWIILDFERDLRRVRICSVSPDTPLILANLIASRHFGAPVTYVNEVLTTPAHQVAKFLDALLAAPGKLPLVEVITRNCALDGAIQLRLNDLDNESLAPAIRQFAAAFRDPLERVRDIDGIKVYAFGKRVKLLFEPVSNADAFIVRYADQPLNTSERRAFEELMKRDFGITVLSTEKKYAQ